VVETSELERAEDLELIAQLKGTAYAEAAKREIIRLRREYEANFARGLLKRPAGEPIPQSEIDFKRGFYHGLLWGYEVFLESAKPKLDKLERAMSETKE
jgi:hypothetical protein